MGGVIWIEGIGLNIKLPKYQDFQANLNSSAMRNCLQLFLCKIQKCQKKYLFKSDAMQDNFLFSILNIKQS